MNNRNIKESFIQSLYDRNEYIRQVNDIEYQTRCPFCGDSQKNLNTGHLYIRINLDDNFPIVYHCFKCEESGIVNSEFLNIMDINDINLKSSIITLNKTSDKASSHKFLYGEKIIQFDYDIPDIYHLSNKIQYIENRLGMNFLDKDLKNMKIIISLYDFLSFNNIKKLQLPKYWCDKIEKHYVGFLSFGSSHILFRDITDKEEYSWIKYPITDESKQCKIFYSMKADIDIFTRDKLIINLSEGIMDAISAYGNLKYNETNTMNIAVCGKHYVGTLMTLVNMGLVGDNIIVNIFSDNDAVYNKKNNNPTTINYFKKILYKIKNLYGEVNIFYNTINKDIGVPRNKISLKKYRL